jgi:hypothetical protein
MKNTALLSSLFLVLGMHFAASAQQTSGVKSNTNKRQVQLQPVQTQLINPARTMLNTPDWSTVKVQQNCLISMMLDVDQNGRVLSAKTNTTKTTTSDPALITEILEKVKSEALFEAKAGVAREKVPYEFELKAE